ncbi:MAG: hypothetical protein ABSB89_04020 [Candidatus Bathyarchaeia archaeon]
MRSLYIIEQVLNSQQSMLVTSVNAVSPRALELDPLDTILSGLAGGKGVLTREEWEQMH